MSEYDRWQTRFAAEHYIFGTAPNAFLARQAPLLSPGMRALTIADGESRNGVWLAEQGLDVTAQDFSPRAQEKARALAQERGVTLAFELCDIVDFDFGEEAWDVVVGIFFQFLAPPERATVLGRMARAVKPGGLVLIEGYRPKQLDYATGGPKQLENFYTPEILRDAFRDFDQVEVTAYDAAVDEGPGHSGLSALIDMVARR